MYIHQGILYKWLLGVQDNELPFQVVPDPLQGEEYTPLFHPDTLLLDVGVQGVQYNTLKYFKVII